MQVTNDGVKFKLYIEGIKVPFINANINYKGMIATASFELFPSKEFNKLPNGALVHLFFKKTGIKEAYKLLFFGSVNGKNISINGGDRRYTLIAYGRASILNNLLVASALKFETSSSSANGIIGLGEGRSALGSFQQEPTRTEPGQLSPDAQPLASPYAEVPNSEDSSSTLGKIAKTVIKIIADAASPVSNIPNEMVKLCSQSSQPISRSLTNPNVIKSTSDKLIGTAMSSTSKFYELAYAHRLKMQPDIFINEFPATWANYVASWGDSSPEKTAFIKMLKQILEAEHGGVSPLSSMLETLASLYFSEFTEIPGLARGALLIAPDLLTSDIPACNMIFPTEQIGINFSDNFGNKITRVVLESPKHDNRGNIIQQRAMGVTDIAMFPNVLGAMKSLTAEVLAKQTQGYTIEGEEYIGSRPYFTPSPANYLLIANFGNVNQDLAEHFYYKLRNAHTNISISMPFSPQLVPGQRAVLFDKHTPLIFKIESIAHIVNNSGAHGTNVTGSSVEYLDSNTKFRHPHWYDSTYETSKIHEVYKAYFGCTSMSDSAAKAGSVYEAYLDIFEKYNSTAIKTYMAEAATQRYFDTEADVMQGLYSANALQQDSEGVIIYTSEAFDNYYLDGYDINMNAMQLSNIRQEPILNYVKTIYGVIGDLHE
mgnify:CR=1 FL=1